VAEEFHKGFPDSDLFWIDQCGHAPMMEHPDAFNEILDAWYDARGIAVRPEADAHRL
jgi:pimeloyl-ACP methyl ester carboxylesterase